MEQDYEPSLWEIYRLCQSIDASMKEQNGRVRACEQDIAVLKDRDDRATDTHARYAAYGSLVTAIFSTLWSSLHGR